MLIETTKYFLQYRHNPVDDDNTPGGIFSPWLGFGLLVLGRLHTNQRSRDSKEKSLHFYHCFTFISCIILFVFLQEMLAYILKAKKTYKIIFSPDDCTQISGVGIQRKNLLTPDVLLVILRIFVVFAISKYCNQSDKEHRWTIKNFPQ